jgi:hypothetical protein
MFLALLFIWLPTLAVGVGVAGCLISVAWCEDEHHWTQRYLVPISIVMACIGVVLLLAGSVLRVL